MSVHFRHGKASAGLRCRTARMIAVLALCGVTLAGCVIYPAGGYYGHGPSYYGSDEYHGHWDRDGDRHRGWDRY